MGERSVTAGWHVDVGLWRNAFQRPGGIFAGEGEPCAIDCEGATPGGGSRVVTIRVFRKN
jgi:hypothetical protein